MYDFLATVADFMDWQSYGLFIAQEETFNVQEQGREAGL